MIKESKKPPFYLPAKYGNDVEKHAYELPGMVSVKCRDLFPEISTPIYDYGNDLSIIRNATKDALAGINIDKIKPHHTVNICCSEHGFSILGGDAYLEMLKTIKEVVEERTGNKNIHLKLAVCKTPSEVKEIDKYFDLKETFGNKMQVACTFDKGVPIETYIGTLWGIEKVYDADWFIYAYYDDPRETYLHRMYRKAFKAFVMNFARYETRSCYHLNWGNTSHNIIPAAIYDSPFVQSKHAFSCFLRSAPAGVCKIDADEDLYAIDRRMMIDNIRDFGLVYKLITSLDKDYIAIWDGHRWGCYLHAGGITSGCVLNGYFDALDLEVDGSMAIKAETWNYEGGPMAKNIMSGAPHLKAIVSNQSWYGLQLTYVPAVTPTFVVGKEQADKWRKDPTNRNFMDFAKEVSTLEEGIEEAKKVANTNNILIFDGSYSSINCSRSLAEEFVKNAPELRSKFMTELYPKYLKQRGIDLSAV